MTIISGNIFVVANGDQWEWTITVTNDSAVSATSVLVTNTVSADADYVSHVVSQGTLNPLTLLWTVGTMAPGASAVLKLTMEVGDIASAPFIVDSVVSSFGTEATPLNNTTTSEVQNLCSAFSSCFQNQTIFTQSLPPLLDFATAIAAIDPVPSCGDIIIFGGGCADTYFTLYSCNGNTWSTPLNISAKGNHGNVLYVSTEPSFDSVKGSDICTYNTIQDAVNAASSGDTIIVLPGEYTLTSFIDLTGKSNLTFDINPGAYVIGDSNQAVIYDNNDYIGYLRITGGGVLQGENTAGIIIVENTDPTSFLDVDNVSIINVDGDGIYSAVSTRLSNVGIYDRAASNSSITTLDKVQVRNVYSNVVDNATSPVLIENITVDPLFTLYYA